MRVPPMPKAIDYPTTTGSWPPYIGGGDDAKSRLPSVVTPDGAATFALSTMSHYSASGVIMWIWLMSPPCKSKLPVPLAAATRLALHP